MSCRLPERLFVGNDIPVVLDDLYDPLSDGATITDATVEVRVYTDSDDVLVAGETWPVTLAWSALAYRYQGVIDAAAEFEIGITYRFVIEVDVSGGRDARFTRRIVAEERPA